MLRSHGSARRERLEAIGHVLTALVLATEGVSRLEHPRGNWPFIALCWVSAAVIAAAAAGHRRLERSFPHHQILFHLAEGAVCAGLVLVTVHEGKVGLPFAWLTATLLLLGVTLFDVIRLVRGRQAAPKA